MAIRVLRSLLFFVFGFAVGGVAVAAPYLF